MSMTVTSSNLALSNQQMTAIDTAVTTQYASDSVMAEVNISLLKDTMETTEQNTIKFLKQGLDITI